MERMIRTTTTFFLLSTLAMLGLLTSPAAFSSPSYSVESCSKVIGTSSKNCYQDDTANGWDATANGSLDGWSSGDIQDWHGNERVPYRFNMSLPAASDASTYIIHVEQDNLQSGVTGVDGATSFYVGAGANAGITEGQETKHCATIAGGSSLPALPYQGYECVVAGPTFTGVDDDGDGRVDEEIANGIDDDGDGLIDEDTMPDCASSTGAEHIQYTVEIHFDPDEAGSSTSNWAMYWLAHFATGSNAFPGSSLNTVVRAHREGESDPANQCPGTPEVPVTAEPATYCDGIVATIVGTPDSDVIHGTSGDDVIFGLAGDDYLYGNTGNDTLCGGDGNDYLNGQDGDDTEDGGIGDDIVYGEAGNDHLLGGDGSDTVYGQDGDDTEYGGAGDDTVDGQAGNDYLSGGDGVDHMNGGDGDDTMYGGAGDDVMVGSYGNDHMYGDAGNDSMNGQPGDDVLDGGADADKIYGGSGADSLSGGTGNDYLNGQSENDALNGGDGTDTCVGGGGTDTATQCETVVQVP